MTSLQLAALKTAAEIVGSQRADEIRQLLNWKNGGCLSREKSPPDFKPISTEEDAAIRALWDAMPGDSCLMDAIHLLASQKAQTQSPRDLNSSHTQQFLLEDDDWKCRESQSSWLQHSA